jgi:sarcosine oxidase subunit alpha
MPRLRPPRDPVTVFLDGEAIVAERGEATAVALVAAGRLALARSPKFHRPRGPSCLRAACDGCLARVDGEPNVMTCRVPAAEGTQVETQNVVGSRQTDLLRMADWFFPEGMNHHELLAGVPGVQRVMQAFARRVAGLGRLPKDAGEARAALRRSVDALVVGAGPAGISAALALADGGRKVEIVDDDLTWGGSARGVGVEGWQPLLDRFRKAIEGSRLRLRLRTTAAGVYRDDVLIAGDDGAEVVQARTLVLAPGGHDGALAFEGNDLPGILSARAASWMLAGGVSPGKRIVVLVSPGAGGLGRALAESHGGMTVYEGVPVLARGAARIKEVTLAGAGRGEEQRLACDTLVIDAPRAPAYELCAQAGARLRHESRGFVVVTEDGRIRDGVFALGEVTGAPLVPDVVARDAARVVEQS